MVGTENHVKTIRLMNTVCDNLSNEDSIVHITSGSFGEGLQMRGSDLDVMLILPYIEVNDEINPIVRNPSKTYFSMMTEDTKPGFAMLRLISSPHPLIVNFCEIFRRGNYLSNALFKKTFLNDITSVVHGPCSSDMHGRMDLAHCLHNVSLSLYHYMCKHVVGTENHVKLIRLMNTVCDNLSRDDNRVIITSGSFGEGLEMRGSDIDVMFVTKSIKVHDKITPITFDSKNTYFSLMTDNSKPGFAMLRLISSPYPQDESLKSSSYYCLGTALQLMGDNVSAKQTFTETVKLLSRYPYAIKRLKRLL
ncbi:unnamed protein product [Mytilus coruscus]|uniref:Uncharacterized protein n=1 Tax=Mytilus coruscus TaxID=42192 RepID=A0A6J8EYA4_MYTCO|nr:unnamed protein product [Mytilus coruscus]